MKPQTIQIFLPDGSPSSIIEGELNNQLIKTKRNFKLNFKHILIIILLLISQVTIAETPIKFNWGKSKAVVTESITKNNKTIRYKYDISIKKKKDGYHLKQGKINFLQIDGLIIEDKKVIKMMSGVASLPELVLDEKGEFIDVIKWGKFIDNYLDALPDPNARSFYEKPQMQNIILMKAYEKWCYWVCLWTDEGLSIDNSIVTKEDVEFMGTLLPQTTEIIHHGKSLEYKNLVKLTIESATGMGDPAKLVENMSKEFEWKRSPDGDDSMPTKGSKVMKIVAHTDEKTLKPRSVVVDIKLNVKSDNDSMTKVEKHIYEFNWK